MQQQQTQLTTLSPAADQADHWFGNKKPIAFEKAAEQVLAAAAADGTRNDIVTSDLRSWAFGSADGQTMALTQLPFPGRPVTQPLELREQAFSQLCHRVGAPPSYIRRLPSKLQVACMNYGLAQERRPALLREAGGEVRALLSDRYTPLDDGTLLEMIGDQLDRLGYRNDVSVRAIGTGKTMVMRLTLPGEAEAIQKDDVIEYGIDIANSELGLRSVQVTPVTYRLVCTNGMRAWRSEASVRMRHVGDPLRLREQLSDAIPVAFAEARGDLNRWRQAVDMMIDSALDEIQGLRAFGVASADTRLIQGELARDLELLPISTATPRLVVEALTDSNVSVFHVANAITAVAKASATTPSRLAMEEVGHRYLRSRVG